MNTDIIQYKELPIMDIADIQFMRLNTDLSENYILNLIGRYIIFKLTDDLDDAGLIGLLEKYEDGELYIRHWNEILLIPVSDIYGIEEFIKPNNDIALSTKFIDNICKIINFRDDVIIGLINNITDFDVIFEVNLDGKFKTIYYPKDMIKDLRILRGVNMKKYMFIILLGVLLITGCSLSGKQGKPDEYYIERYKKEAKLEYKENLICVVNTVSSSQVKVSCNYIEGVNCLKYDPRAYTGACITYEYYATRSKSKIYDIVYD